MKKVFLYMFFSLLSLFLTVEAKSTVSNSSSKSNLSSTLGKAFMKISELETFETIEKADDINDHFVGLGDFNGVVSPNARKREEVIGILREIPVECFYSEERTDNDKIARCYIDTDSEGNTYMLFALIGTGGSDLCVVLLSGAPMTEYQMIGDSLKRVTFEEIENAVVMQNAECPMLIGSGMEISSMSINPQYWTMRMNIDTSGLGLQEFDHDKAIQMVKGVGKKQISEVFNLNVGLRMVFNDELGDSKTIVFNRSDMAEILNAEDASPEQSIAIYIENNRKALPVQIEAGMSMTDIGYVDDYLIHEITIDEEMYSLDALEQNKDVIRQNVCDLISNKQDLAVSLLAEWLILVDKGFGYLYVGDTSGKVVLVLLSSDELRQLLIE